MKSPPEHNHHEHSPHLAHHFESLGQQFDAAKLGMWLFLATEVLLFGGLFCVYAVYRGNHPEMFEYGSTFLDTSLPRISGGMAVNSKYTGFALDQDTGGAIRAPGRCDVYMGVGDEAGNLAGKVYQEGRLYYLFLKMHQL